MMPRCGMKAPFCHRRWESADTSIAELRGPLPPSTSTVLVRPPGAQVAVGEPMAVALVVEVARVRVGGTDAVGRVDLAVPLPHPRQHLGQTGDQRGEPVGASAVVRGAVLGDRHQGVGLVRGGPSRQVANAMPNSRRFVKTAEHGAALVAKVTP